MRRGALQDQELVGSGALGRGPRGAPASSGPVVPVLVFPPDLVFRADQRSGPRQLLTLYNPTGAALRFRVLCTAPTKYTVFDAEGYVKPQSCIDIVIRHVAPIPSHYDVQDRFRIELSQEGAEGRVVGRKDITSVLRAPTYPLELQGQPDPAPCPEHPSWTAPAPARHLPERRARQPATPDPARVPGAEVSGSLCLGPPHHGVPPKLSRCSASAHPLGCIMGRKPATVMPGP
ncbi:motile sperm domain-containing protein 3 isoform X3 [Erinaceus europaeus]|uniref:Motile sperm domain-containing protein 3 n=1 Tax=Erinaceus europaeus TaxID=9365 RepID=A0A1S3WR66_ERIEU|nr:motile sperm domain-containing protein 3 isoform X3 [Erinaceus europaeus]